MSVIEAIILPRAVPFTTFTGALTVDFRKGGKNLGGVAAPFLPFTPLGRRKEHHSAFGSFYAMRAFQFCPCPMIVGDPVIFKRS